MAPYTNPELEIFAKLCAELKIPHERLEAGVVCNPKPNLRIGVSVVNEKLLLTVNGKIRKHTHTGGEGLFHDMPEIVPELL